MIHEQPGSGARLGEGRAVPITRPPLAGAVATNHPVVPFWG
jgi:hypothetical protein